MNGSDELTPRLRSWLKEPVSLREDGIAKVGQAVHVTPQQHGPLPPLRTILDVRWFAFGGGVAMAATAFVLGGLLLLLAAGPPATDPAPAAVSASPSPSPGPPDWPGVTFEPVAEECADGCDWASGGVWSVEAEHGGDVGNIRDIAFGPDGAPWFLAEGTIWQLGKPDAIAIGGVLGDDLAVAADGTVWVASDNGLHAFDGEAWTEPWVGGNLDHVDVAPDGTVAGVGRGWRRGADGYPVVLLRADGTVFVDSVDVLPEGIFPADVMVGPEGRIWVGAIASGYWPIAPGESLIAYSDDSEGWTADRSLGPDVSVAAGGFTRAPDGSIWATLSTLPDEGEWGTYLARHDGQEWRLHQPEHGDVPYWLAPSVGRADGTVWLPAPDVVPNVPGGVVAYHWGTWTWYLVGEEIGVLAAGPDGTALVTTHGSHDGEGQLYAIRRRSPG